MVTGRFWLIERRFCCVCGDVWAWRWKRAGCTHARPGMARWWLP